MNALMWVIAALIVGAGSVLFVSALCHQSHDEDEWAERTFEGRRRKELAGKTDGKEKPCGKSGKSL